LLLAEFPRPAACDRSCRFGGISAGTLTPATGHLIYEFGDDPDTESDGEALPSDPLPAQLRRRALPTEASMTTMPWSP
jgi:hypothetical protein